jgi:hypothetical protein
MENGVPKSYTPIKHPNISTMKREESEEIHNRLYKLENQFNKLKGRSMTSYFITLQREIKEVV